MRNGGKNKSVVFIILFSIVNYRPISNLPFLSKILEKVVSSQFYSFLEKNDFPVRI